RRAFYSSLICCQVVIFRSFRRFLQQLQPLALAISRKREANSTGIAMNVNPLSAKKLKNHSPIKSGCLAASSI
ncbi:hypothetical protein, partial [Pseudomonas carnis]|uniref:hypothetical protein n=1 Tax=Pseudomonas carnis TaxID=2487355 RepID=UPI001E506D2C